MPGRAEGFPGAKLQYGESSGMKLGVDIYSVRSQGWDAFQHLEYGAQIGLDIVHFSDLSPFASLEDDYLKRVKTRADELGLSIEAGMLSVCPISNIFDDTRGTAVEQIREMLHVADVLGSPILRAVLGTGPDRKDEIGLQARIDATVETLRAVRSQCLDLGIKMAIENHGGDMQGAELKGLIEAAGPEFVGACIDTGNPFMALESPFVTLAHLAPYVITSHIRDTSIWPHPKGAAMQWVAMGDGNIGIREWVAEFKKQCPAAPFSLEIITGHPARVLNYLEPEFWPGFENVPAQEFAQLEKLARKGVPYMGTMVTCGDSDLPPEYEAAMVAQQRYDLERSVRFCREELGIGERA